MAVDLMGEVEWVGEQGKWVCNRGGGQGKWVCNRGGGGAREMGV